MNDDLVATVRAALGDVAPELDVDALDAAADLRDTADLDSVDFLNLVVALHERTGVQIPEADYGALTSLDAIAGYLARRSH